MGRGGPRALPRLICTALAFGKSSNRDRGRARGPPLQFSFTRYRSSQAFS
jgi:hypothetical protein